MENSDSLILLNPQDNVLVAGREIAKGESVVISGMKIEVSQNVKLGFKLAAKKITTGEKILKYGIPIGSASMDILPGEIVHIHNLQSDYSQTYTIENQNDYEGK